jgi:hypothetical protein
MKPPWHAALLFGLASCSDASAVAVDAGTTDVLDAATTMPPLNGCALQACPTPDDGLAGSPVSFRRDLVLPLQRNCSDAICHGSPAGSAAGLYLGPPLPVPVDTASLIGRLVDVASRTAPELPLIAPGEPARSFLLLKIEGCQNTGSLTCRPQPGAKGTAPCGDTMPQAARALCNAERDFLRRWVLQGASDN